MTAVRARLSTLAEVRSMEVDLNLIANRIAESGAWRRAARDNERNGDWDACLAHATMAIAESLEALALLELGKVQPVAVEVTPTRGAA
jgi:hypothetical protein